MQLEEAVGEVEADDCQGAERGLALAAQEVGHGDEFRRLERHEVAAAEGAAGQGHEIERPQELLGGRAETNDGAEAVPEARVRANVLGAVPLHRVVRIADASAVHFGLRAFADEVLDDDDGLHVACDQLLAAPEHALHVYSLSGWMGSTGAGVEVRSPPAGTGAAEPVEGESSSGEITPSIPFLKVTFSMTPSREMC